MGICIFTLYYVVCCINRFLLLSPPAKDKIFQILIKRRLLLTLCMVALFIQYLRREEERK